jgi:hypothetical protein
MRNKRLFNLSECYAVDVQYLLRCSTLFLSPAYIYVVLYTGWSTFPRPHCLSVDIMFYYIQSDQHFLSLIARQLIICCIAYRMINIFSAPFLVSWYYVVLYTEWSTFPRPHCSSVDMLYYIQSDQHFLGLIARQLILCCIIYRVINTSSASLLVSWYYVVLYTGYSILSRSHCSSVEIMLYYIQDVQHFFGLIARTSQENRMRVK